MKIYKTFLNSSDKKRLAESSAVKKQTISFLLKLSCKNLTGNAKFFESSHDSMSGENFPFRKKKCPILNKRTTIVIR